MTMKGSKKTERRLKKRKRCLPHGTIMLTMTRNQLLRLKQKSLKQLSLWLPRTQIKMNKPMKRKKQPPLSSSTKEAARTTNGKTKMTMLEARLMQRLTPQTMLQLRRVSPLKSKTRRKLRQQLRQPTLSRKPRLLLSQHPRHSKSKSLYNSSSSRQLSHATHRVNGSSDGEKPCFSATSRVAFSTLTIRR